MNKETKKSNFDKKKLVSVIIGALSFLIAYYAMQHFVFNKKNTIDQVLVEVVNEMNKNCPMNIDKDTRLDNSLALPNKTLQYNYTLVNMDNDDINSDELKSYLKPRVLSSIKTNPDMKYLRDNKVNFVYSYVDKDNEFVLKIIIPSKMYLENAN